MGLRKAFWKNIEKCPVLQGLMVMLNVTSCNTAHTHGSTSYVHQLTALVSRLYMILVLRAQHALEEIHAKVSVHWGMIVCSRPQFVKAIRCCDKIGPGRSSV